MTTEISQGRAALVTGGAKGIGRATVARFLDAGAAVAIVDIDREASDRACDELRARGQVIAIPADVAKAGEVTRAVNHACRTFGRLDVLVNNAAVHFARAIDAYTPEEIDLLLDVDLKGRCT